jgi:16S rRNA (cytidine1402-2'-O)-methyltransferase
MDNNHPTVNLKPGLYLVATPIGNLRDITLRALDTLKAVELVACEDTRVTAKLMNAYSLKKKLIIYNDHVTDRQRDVILDALAAGQSVALVSDAGMPMISDPGYRLVKDATERGFYVTSVPGASAPLMALQLSGLPSDAFSFIGFLPAKNEARKARLRDWANAQGTLVLFETGPRLVSSLETIAECLGNREICVARELTKMYEEARRGTIDQVLQHYQENGPPKGEIVIVIAAGKGDDAALDVDDLLQQSLALMSVRDAAAHVAEITGQPKKEIYARALQLASQNDED